MYIEYFLKIQKHLLILITIFLLNIQISFQITHPCKDNYVLNNKTCYNDVIIFEHDRFRAGHASTNKNGDTIFEFSLIAILVRRDYCMVLKQMEDITFLESLYIKKLH